MNTPSYIRRMLHTMYAEDSRVITVGMIAMGAVFALMLVVMNYSA